MLFADTDLSNMNRDGRFEREAPFSRGETKDQKTDEFSASIETCLVGSCLTLPGSILGLP